MRFRDICLGEPSIIAAYDFTEAAGNLVPIAGAATGTAAGGGITRQQGALIYDDVGADSAITDNSVPGQWRFGDVWDFNGTAAFTFELIIVHLGPDDPVARTIFNKGLIGAGGGYQLDHWSDPTNPNDRGTVRFRRADAAGAADELYPAETLRIGQRNHIVITYDGSTMSYYQNGHLATTAGSSRSLPNTTEEFSLGAFQTSTSGGAGDGVDMQFGWFAVYNTALTAARVRKHYKMMLNPRRRVPVYFQAPRDLVDDYMRMHNIGGDGAEDNESTIGIWAQNTNLITNSIFRTNVSGYSTDGASVSRDTSKFKFGNASMKVDTAGSNPDEGVRPTGTFAVSPGTGWASSAWVWAPTGAEMMIWLEENIGGAWVDTSAQTFVGNGDWQYVDVGRTLTSGSADNIRTGIMAHTTPQNIDFWVDGWQLEQTTQGFARLYPTPLLPTDGSTAARAYTRIYMDISDIPTSFWTQGWVAFRVKHGFDWIPVHGENAGLFFAGTSNDRYDIYYNGLSSVNTVIAIGGVDDDFANVSPNMTKLRGDITTMMGGWNNAQALAANDDNGPFVGDGRTTKFIPAGTNVDLLSLLGWFGGRFNGYGYWVAMGLGDLTSGVVDALHAIPNTPAASTPPELPGSAFWFWNCKNNFANVLGAKSSFYRGAARTIRRR